MIEVIHPDVPAVVSLQDALYRLSDLKEVLKLTRDTDPEAAPGMRLGLRYVSQLEESLSILSDFIGASTIPEEQLN